MHNYGYKQELKRSLAFSDLLIYGIIFMVPIAPFGIYGYVVKESQGMVALAYLVGMIGMIFTALSYARLAEVFPIAGSIYSYAQRGINEDIGFFAGWLILLDYILVPAVLCLVSATALHNLVPELPIVLWLVFFIALNTMINILGIEITAKANKIIVVLEIIVVLAFIGAGGLTIFQHLQGTSFSFKPLIDSDKFSLSLVMKAASLSVLSFLGFDAITTLSEEVADGRKAVGKAVMLSLILVGVLFIIQTWIAALIVPHYDEFPSLDSAFYEIAEKAGGAWLRWVTILATALAWGVANALVAQAAISRILYSMARDNKLPMFLAAVHPKFKTPYLSIILVALVSLVIALFFQERIDDLAALINFGALTAFLILHLTVINYFIFKKNSRDYFNHLLFPLVGLAVIGCVWLSLGDLAKKLGFIWICIGILYMLGMRIWGKGNFSSRIFP